jgi:hypothetical protein
VIGYKSCSRRAVERRSLAVKEIEELEYYDFMGYMGVPFFNVGGAASMDRLAELCRIEEDAVALDVGCGTGTGFSPPRVAG